MTTERRLCLNAEAACQMEAGRQRKIRVVLDSKQLQTLLNPTISFPD